MPAALEPDSGHELVCYECARERDGGSAVEGDHVAGQHNDPSAIVELPGNAHRLASDEMRDWPDLTACNPHGSPLRWGAAMVRGWLDRLYVILEFAGRVPSVLEELDDLLSAHLGRRWWEVIGFRWPR